MARTVQLSEDAYATLTALKKEGESFSDTVLRLARRGKRSILDWRPGPREAGWTPAAQDRMRAETREEDAKRLAGHARRRAD